MTFYIHPVFEPKTYPEPVITKADNHPVYVNGTELINGMPMIKGTKTDSSRIDEFKKLGFSAIYINQLTDSAYNQYYSCTKGTRCNYGLSLPYKPSYTKITSETILHDPDNYDVLHKVEIIDHKVYFNGREIASAPEPFTGKLKGKSQWTPARRLQFCKAVVWAIDPSYQGYITKRVKNSNGQMEDQSFPDDLYFRELIAKYPAVPEVIAVSAPIVPVDIPEVLNAYTPEGITGYPDGEIFKYTPDYDAEDYDTLLINGMFEHGPSVLDNEIDTAFLDDIEKDSIGEMFSAFIPAVIRSWTRGSMVITEEVRA